MDLQTIFKIYEMNPNIVFKNVSREDNDPLYLKKFSELKHYSRFPSNEKDLLYICIKEYDEFYKEDRYRIPLLSKDDILCDTYEIINEE